MPIVTEIEITRVFLPQLTALRDAVFGRILPCFDQLEDEANEIEREAFKRLELTASEDSDPFSIAEAALDAGIEHFQAMTGARQTVINAFTVATSHLFEQQRHLAGQTTLLDHEPDSRKREEGFRALLHAHGVEWCNFDQLPTLEELSVVANVTKHAEGQSADRLRVIRPELFVYPALRRERAAPGPPSYSVNGPLMGEDLFVEPDDLRAYLDAVESFWNFVLEGLRPR